LTTALLCRIVIIYFTAYYLNTTPPNINTYDSALLLRNQAMSLLFLLKFMTENEKYLELFQHFKGIEVELFSSRFGHILNSSNFLLTESWFAY
jgi:hypothetical protein